MPLVCEPNATFDYVLECDRDKPLESRPTFVFRYLNCRKWRELAAISDSLGSGKSGPEVMDICLKVITEIITDWRNITDANGQELPYNPDNLADILTMSEVQEMMLAGITQQSVSDEDKKKSESQSVSKLEPSAKTVQAD